MATELNQDDKERKRIKRGSKLQGQKVHEIKQEATESETRQKLSRQTGRQKHEHNKKTRRRKSKRNHFYKQRVKVKSDLQKNISGRYMGCKLLYGWKTWFLHLCVLQERNYISQYPLLSLLEGQRMDTNEYLY